MAAKKEPERRAAERRTPPKPAPKSTPKPPFEISTNSTRADLSPDELRKLIAEAAYYRAKKRGFAPGHELEDWIQAEAEVMGRLGASDRPS
jgi:Protein of unknown function (DUF2934)